MSLMTLVDTHERNRIGTHAGITVESFPRRQAGWKMLGDAASHPKSVSES